MVEFNYPLRFKGKITKTLRGDPRVIEGHFMVSLIGKRRSGQTVMANYSSVLGLTTMRQTPRNWWSKAVSLLKKIN